MPVLANPQHELFCQEKAKGATGRDAYTTAGFKSKNPASHDMGAKRLMERPEIRARLDELLARGAEKAELTVARVLRELELYAFNGKGERATMKALELIGKHLGMFKEVHEHSGPGGGPIEVRELSDKEAARRVAFLLAKGLKDEA